MKVIDQEKRTWDDHTITYDDPVREANLQDLENWENGTKIQLAYITNTQLGFSYQHWLVTDGSRILEFGSITQDIYTVRVTINTMPRAKYTIHEGSSTTTRMNDTIRERMRHVLGMCNYSLCLRNCEHVANYVFRGVWYSQQMEKGGMIRKFMKKWFVGKVLQLVNIPPLPLRMNICGNNQMYSFTDGHYRLSNIDYYYLNKSEDTFNILTLGPSGAGKSRLIDICFNREICSSKSITRDVVFIRGTGDIYDLQSGTLTPREVVMIDSMGFCDTQWRDEEVIDFIKSRVSSNVLHLDAVCITLKADRPSEDVENNVKKVLRWLNYSKYFGRFNFLFTFSENLNDADKQTIREDAIRRFGLKNTQRLLPTGEAFDSLMFVSFPPDVHDGDANCHRVKDSWSHVQKALTQSVLGERIKVQAKTSLFSACT